MGVTESDEIAGLLAELEAAGEPVRPPQVRPDPALLSHLGITEPAASDLLAAADEIADDAELLEVFRGLVARTVADIGLVDTPLRRWPELSSRWGHAGHWLYALALLATTEDVRAWHRARGVPDDVSWASLAEIGRQVHRHTLFHGTPGMMVPFWVALPFTGGLFEIGRLQYTPHRLRIGISGPLFWYGDDEAAARGVGFRAGDPALGLHIPASGPLTAAAVDDSLQRAREFFSTVFPDPARRIVVCTSWLLDEQLLDVLPPASNIAEFQRRFTLVEGSFPADGDVLTYVFHRVDRPSLDELPQRSTLERAAVAHWRADGQWLLRTGWLPLD